MRDYSNNKLAVDNTETQTIVEPDIPVVKKTGFFEKLFNWELWPAWAVYAPLAPAWIWHVLRTRSIWFFTASNPTIPFGGYEGETKSGIYKQLPIESYPRTRLITHSADFESVKEIVKEAGFEFPFIVKPDIGRKGLLFRKIDNEADLLAYHQFIPFDYIVQDLIDLPVELGVFYVRHPNSKKGKITGIILRESMEVWGDGVTPLRTLILQHPQASKRADLMFKRHQERLDWIPADKERFVLTYAVNRSRGGRLRNLTHEADAELTEFFDRLNNYSEHFYWGRYDIKCNSIAELKKGQNYAILEYNGAGASPSHIYHCGMTFGQAVRELQYHWKLMYEVCQYNFNQGVERWSFFKGLRYLRKVNRYLDELDEYEGK
ncbi:MAG: hypothetical protein R2778_11140 [Saprospiraceae bacterium]|nr:hypothetical protein [Lewinellaceae bacterium]